VHTHPPSTHWKHTGDDGWTCLECSTGTYKDEAGSVACSTCPLNANSSAASTNLSDCECNPGYTGPTGNGGICNSCAVNMYKEISGSAACLNCPTYSTSPLTSDAITNCVCNLGYQGQPGENCTTCARGKYATVLRTCSDCPDNAMSQKTRNVTDCFCKVGYFGIIQDAASSCTICPPDHYKDTNGSVACTACPPFSNASAGSINRSDCLCQVGYTRIIENENSTCEMCPLDHYKDTNGSAACTQCPLFSRAIAGSVNLSDCKCNMGMYGYVWNSKTRTCDLFPSFVSCGIACLMKSGNWSCNTTCGDGLRAGLEECDDGNVLDGDGCNANCTLEPGFKCSSTAVEISTLTASLPPPESVVGAPSVCVRDKCSKDSGNPVELMIVLAQATASAVTVAVAVAVSVGVAAGVAGGVAGGAAGGNSSRRTF
jgi:cysteine-rich repeat protein